MSCPIEVDETKGSNGKVLRYTYSLVKPIDTNVLEKLKPNQRNTKTNLPRKTAFATISLLDSPEEEGLAKYLGRAVNKDSFPADLKAMFDEDGALLSENRRKIAYLGLLDRENQDFKNKKNVGTYVKRGNIESIFGLSPSNVNSNSVLKKYYLPHQDESKRELQLVRGSASQLLECLLGPTSPLHELGVEYVILHPVSRELETNYYARKFGFQPALGIPIGLASMVMYNNATEEEEESLLENLEYFPSADAEQGGPEIKKWTRYLLRALDDRVYQLHESTTTGPIMYKKLAQKENSKSEPKTRTLPLQSEPKVLSQPKANTPRLSKKQIARLLFNAIPGTRKLFPPAQAKASKRTMKRRAKHRG